MLVPLLSARRMMPLLWCSVVLWCDLFLPTYGAANNRRLGAAACRELNARYITHEQAGPSAVMAFCSRKSPRLDRFANQFLSFSPTNVVGRKDLQRLEVGVDMNQLASKLVQNEYPLHAVCVENGGHVYVVIQKLLKPATNEAGIKGVGPTWWKGSGYTFTLNIPEQFQLVGLERQHMSMSLSFSGFGLGLGDFAKVGGGRSNVAILKVPVNFSNVFDWKQFVEQDLMGFELSFDRRRHRKVKKQHKLQPDGYFPLSRLQLGLSFHLTCAKKPAARPAVDELDDAFLYQVDAPRQRVTPERYTPAPLPPLQPNYYLSQSDVASLKPVSQVLKALDSASADSSVDSSDLDGGYGSSEEDVQSSPSSSLKSKMSPRSPSSSGKVEVSV